MAGRVLVVGSFNLDHVWNAPRLPVPGETRAGTYAAGPGGKGFNQAVAAARSGAPTAFCTALGADDAGALARRLADADGIALHARVADGLPTGTAGILVDGEARNLIVVAAGANAALTADDARAACAGLAAGDAVLAQLEVPAAAVEAALAAGRAAGARTLLNPAPADAPTTPALLALADLLTPNETEFAALLARHAATTVDPDALAAMPDGALHALCDALRGATGSAATLVVTLGRHGAFRSSADGGHARFAAERVQAVDSTAAGDAFNGALAAGLVAGLALDDALRAAGRYAALSTERPGAAGSLPRADEVRARFGP